MKRQIQVGSVLVGGDAPVSIQSMLNTKTTDVAGSLAQIRALKAAGCQIARLAVPDMEAAKGFRDIAAESPLPLVADIHFDYRLAIAAAEGGASKIRINPGNIGGRVQGKAYSHPHWRQWRLAGKGDPCKVWASHGGGAGGKCIGPCGAAGGAGVL